MVKKNSWTFDHPILDNLPPLKQGEIPELVKRVEQGDQNARQILLFQLLAYVKLRLPGYLKQMCALKRDVDGLVGYLTVWLLNTIDNKADPRLLHYVAKSVRGECQKYQYRMRVYGPVEDPTTAWKHQRQDPHVPDLPIPQDVEFLSLDDLDEIRAKARNDNEYLFMLYRLQGYTNKEIALMLGISAVAVTRLRKVLAPRFGV